MTLFPFYSDDMLFSFKALRNGGYQVIFTTTILERGFTMAKLDVGSSIFLPTLPAICINALLLKIWLLQTMTSNLAMVNI
jgi:hypothetical protein